jgi:hypothetical protein
VPLPPPVPLLLLALPPPVPLLLLALPLLLAPLELLLVEAGIGLHWSFIPAGSIWQPHWQSCIDVVAPFWQS